MSAVFEKHVQNLRGLEWVVGGGWIASRRRELLISGYTCFAGGDVRACIVLWINEGTVKGWR